MAPVIFPNINEFLNIFKILIKCTWILWLCRICAPVKFRIKHNQMCHFFVCIYLFILLLFNELFLSLVYIHEMNIACFIFQLCNIFVPVELWNKMQPNVTHFCLFYCILFSLIIFNAIFILLMTFIISEMLKLTLIHLFPFMAVQHFWNTNLCRIGNLDTGL